LQTALQSAAHAAHGSTLQHAEAGPQLTRKLSAQQAVMLGLYALTPATSTTPGAFGAFTRCVIEHGVQRNADALQRAACSECTVSFATSMHSHLAAHEADGRSVVTAEELTVERATRTWQCVCSRAHDMVALPDAGQVSAYFSSCLHATGSTPFELQAQALFDEALAAQQARERVDAGPLSADDVAMLLFPPCWLASWVLATISWRRRRHQYADGSAERLAALV
jgi:hypothetical protein